MVAEFRAQRLDLAARAKFAADGDTVRETRAHIADDTKTREEAGAEIAAGTERSLIDAAAGGYVEVEVG